MSEQSRKVDFDLQERLYVQQALKRYIESLQRSLGKEVAGSDIAVLRSKEIQSVESVLRKVS